MCICKRSMASLGSVLSTIDCVALDEEAVSPFIRLPLTHNMGVTLKIKAASRTTKIIDCKGKFKIDVGLRSCSGRDVFLHNHTHRYRTHHWSWSFSQY